MTLPQAEDALEDYLGDGYADGKWRPALAAVMAAKSDVDIALEAINKIQLASGLDTPPPLFLTQISTEVPQWQDHEKELEVIEL
jgi:hypothetical protein